MTEQEFLYLNALEILLRTPVANCSSIHLDPRWPPPAFLKGKTMGVEQAIPLLENQLFRSPESEAILQACYVIREQIRLDREEKCRADC